MRVPRSSGQSSLLLLAALLAVPAAALAQTKEGTLLTGKDLTKQGLVEALTPGPEATPDQEATGTLPSRGITAGQRSSTAMAAIQPRKKPSASLLITFETNSSQLTSQSKQQLDTVAAALKDDRLSAFSFDVEGHADSRGSSSANLALSQRRAESTREYLVEQHGIPPQRLHAIGKGDREPWNTHDIAAPVNRRVAFTTVKP